MVNLKKMAWTQFIIIILVCVMVFCGCARNTENQESDSGKIETESETETVTEPITAESTTVQMTTDSYYDKDYSTPDGFYFKNDAVNYGNTILTEYSSSTTGTVKRANVILPYGYDGTKKYPVLYLLHGRGADYHTWDVSVNAKYIVQNAAKFRGASDMIVVCPSVFTFGGKLETQVSDANITRGFDAFIDDLLNNLMPHINNNFAVKTGRENTAIAGLSIGGREALYIGFAHQELFGYIGAFSPEDGVVNTGNPKNKLPPLLSEFAVRPEVGDFKFILIAVGNLDDVCGYASYEYDRLLNEKSIKHMFYELPVGHDIVVWRSGLYNFARRIFRE